ncbi:MAG: hypothetical protein K2G01_09710, partial [Paramuribaculum sp.]|nr:hypothetical protein [Paramuribaculum sp.]
MAGCVGLISEQLGLIICFAGKRLSCYGLNSLFYVWPGVLAVMRNKVLLKKLITYCRRPSLTLPPH